MTDLLSYPSLFLGGDITDIYSDNTTYSDAVWLTTHNAFVNIDDGWDIHPQQRLNIVDQFMYGVRSFMIDVHESENGLVLRHGTIATLPGITHSSKTSNSLVDFFSTIKKLLENNTRDIITIHIENYASNTAVKTDLDKAGLSSYLLLTNPNNNVALSEMRSTGQRLVIFSDEEDVAKGIYKVNLLKETTYDLNDDEGCVDRKERRASFDDKSINLFLLNHYYKKACIHDCTGISSHISNKDCSSVNSYISIMHRVNLCIAQGHFPNFIAVDFAEKGDFGGAKALVTTLNKVDKYSLLRNTTISLPAGEDSSTESMANMAIYFIGVPLIPTIMPMILDGLCSYCNIAYVPQFNHLAVKYAKYFSVFVIAQTCNYFIKSSVGYIITYSTLSLIVSLSHYSGRVKSFGKKFDEHSAV